jgi:uncharacterized RDD family membrane protein YckC
MSNPYAPPLAAVRDIVDPALRAAPADRATRLGAAIVDTFIFIAIVYVPLLSIGLMGGGDPAIADTVLAFGGIVALVGFTAWAALTITYMKRNGQSLGKKLLGIKVVRSDGSPVSLGRLIWLRNVVNWLFSIVPVYGLIDTLFIFGESRQCLHDKIADTIVIKA